MNALKACWTWIKRHANWLRWPVAVTVLSYLFYLNWDVVEKLSEREIRWEFFAAGLALCGGSIVLTFIRWYLLVWALEFPFRVRDALRLGFVGYLFNYVGPGAVGGDLYKAVMIARGQTSRRIVAVATILLDRVLGLLALFVVASFVALFQLATLDSPFFKSLVLIYGAAAAGGLVGLGIVLIPGTTNNRAIRSLARLPVVGNTIASLLDGFALYQARPRVLILAVAISLVGHFGMLSSFYCCGLALNPADAIPSYAAHLFFIPAAEVFSMLPIFPGGIGGLEQAIAYLYGLAGAESGNGFITGLGFRAVTIAIAAIGGLYYLTARKEIDAALHDGALPEPNDRQPPVAKCVEAPTEAMSA